MNPERRQRLRRARAGVSLAFLLFGAVYFTWAARLPAVKDDLGLSNGELAVALIGLEAGALVGLQLGGILVPRTGSRTVLAVSLPLLGVLLAGPALAGNLVTLTAAAAALAVTINVANVAMTAHGVAVEQRYGRPILSSLYAMHSLGGIAGAGVAALAAGLGVGRAGHLLAVAAAVALAAAATSRLLLPPSVDASPAGPTSAGRSLPAALAGWLRGWWGRVMVLGALAFCVELAQNSGSTWGAVWLRDSVGTNASTAAAGLAILMAGTTAGRLAGDRLRLRFGPVRLFRAGALVAGAGFGGALLAGTPAAGIAGLALLGAGTSFLLPLTVSAAGSLPGETAPAVARVATLGALGSFTAPALIGSLAGPLQLAGALTLPALLVAATALAARAVQPATTRRSKAQPAPTQPG